MKKVKILISICLLLSFDGYSQNNEWQVGLGVNYSDFGNQIDLATTFPAITLDLNYSVPSSKTFSIGFGIQYLYSLTVFDYQKMRSDPRFDIVLKSRVKNFVYPNSNFTYNYPLRRGKPLQVKLNIGVGLPFLSYTRVLDFSTDLFEKQSLYTNNSFDEGMYFGSGLAVLYPFSIGTINLMGGVNTQLLYFNNAELFAYLAGVKVVYVLN